MPASTGTAFYGHKAKGIRRWEDGLENTIIIVEVDDDRSVLWTRPADLDFNPLKPREGLGNLRADGFFAIWGGQQISLIGSRATQFALVWWLTVTTGSATVLATATMIAFIPSSFTAVSRAINPGCRDAYSSSMT